MEKKDREKAQAILTLHNIDKMSRGKRKRIASWLRRQIENLENSGHNYADLFRARYY